MSFAEEGMKAKTKNWPSSQNFFPEE